jgi:hypothetical protein
VGSSMLLGFICRRSMLCFICMSCVDGVASESEQGLGSGGSWWNSRELRIRGGG